MAKLRTIVADDIPASLQMMIKLLEDRCEIVATASDGFQAVDAIRRFNPEIAILDISMPGLNGLGIAREVSREQPTLGIIICTVRQDQEFINAAADAGARGYVFKVNIFSDLGRAVDAVASGGVFWSERPRRRNAHCGLLDKRSAHHEISDRELRAIYENVPGIVFCVSVEPDGDFRFQSMSQAGLAAMGLSREAVEGSLVRDVIPLPSRDLVLNNYRDAIRSGQTVRWREESVYPAGRKIGEVAVTPLFDADGAATHLIGMVHDLTEREQLEELLLMQRDEEHNHALKLLLETCTQGIVSVDANGLIVTANQSLEAMFGWKRSEMLGRPIEMLMPAAFRSSHQQHRVNYFSSPRARLMGGGLVLIGERRDGSRFPIEVSLNHVHAPVGDLAFAFVTDVSERKRTEEALSNISEKLIRAQEQERTRIGRELHDDIGQRLALLSLALCELEEDPSDVQKRLTALRENLNDISEDVQALSHELHSSKLEYLGVVAGMRSWCKEFGDWQEIDILFESDVFRALPFDIGLCLFRILQEALHNAAKHSAAKQVTVQLREDSGAICLAINDSGKGFDIKAATHGRGVGLASMQERVRLVNGTISIDSKLMGGTTIHVRVPLHTDLQTSLSA